MKTAIKQGHMGTNRIKAFSFTSLGTPGPLCAALGLSELNKLPRADGESEEERKTQRMGQAGSGEKASLIKVEGKNLKFG